MKLKNLSSMVELTLPDDLLWSDEHAWTPPVSSVSYLVTGAIVVQTAVRQAGRPITLVGAFDMAWVTRSTLNTLHDWAGVAVTDTTGRFLLTLADLRSFTVAFRHAETALESEPVKGFPARSDAEFYRLTLRFLEL